MARVKIRYPKSLRDIPSWRRHQLAEDLLWFSRFSPSQRLRYVDREWGDIQTYIEKFGHRDDGAGKRT